MSFENAVTVGQHPRRVRAHWHPPVRVRGKLEEGTPVAALQRREGPLRSPRGGVRQVRQGRGVLVLTAAGSSASRRSSTDRIHDRARASRYASSVMRAHRSQVKVAAWSGPFFFSSSRRPSFARAARSCSSTWLGVGGVHAERRISRHLGQGRGPGGDHHGSARQGLQDREIRIPRTGRDRRRRGTAGTGRGAVPRPRARGGGCARARGWQPPAPPGPRRGN